MTYDTVIFDLDGTLLYTLEDLTLSTNYALEPFTDVRRSLDEVRSFVGNGVRTLMIRALPGGEQNPDFEAAFARFRAHYAVHCRDHTRPYPGIMDAVRALAARGLKLGIVSNKPDPEVKDMNRVYFTGLFGAALGEREGVRRKPAPDAVLEVMKRLGATAEETVYIGDSDVDCATAANAGTDFIGVCWGFRPREVLEESGAKVVCATADELLALILGSER